jgi:predicted benzoate:H+ symporter BenE
MLKQAFEQLTDTQIMDMQAHMGMQRMYLSQFVKLLQLIVIATPRASFLARCVSGLTVGNLVALYLRQNDIWTRYLPSTG